MNENKSNNSSCEYDLNLTTEHQLPQSISIESLSLLDDDNDDNIAVENNIKFLLKDNELPSGVESSQLLITWRIQVIKIIGTHLLQD